MAKKTKKTQALKTGTRAKHPMPASRGRKAGKTTKRAGKAKSVAPKTKKAKAVAKAKRGRRMAPGRGWRLSPNGGKTVFAGTLVAIQNLGKQRIAIFSVPKRR